MKIIRHKYVVVEWTSSIHASIEDETLRRVHFIYYIVAKLILP
jgi:hypothetical protein